MQKRLPGTIESNDGEIKFPYITTMYDFFYPRTKTIEIWSFGFRNGGFEVTIAESTGAKVKLFDARPGVKENYEIYSRILESHECRPSDPKWAQEYKDRWILSDSISLFSELPSAYTGNIDISGVNTPLKKFDTNRVDVCKIDYDAYTMDIVYSILHAGYRPGLFFINWPNSPDESSITMTCAGHLQTCGYRLLKAIGNYFLYIYVDECMYELCSWQRVDCPNPMFSEFKIQLLNGPVHEPSK